MGFFLQKSPAPAKFYFILFKKITIIKKNQMHIHKTKNKHIYLPILGFLAGCQSPDSSKIDPMKNSDSIETLTSIPAKELSSNFSDNTTRPRSRKAPLSKPTVKIPPVFKTPVTITIGDNLPLKTALLSLSQQSGIDLQLEAEIKDKILYSAKDQPLINVIREICDLANLRYEISHKSIQIKKDTPYAQTYSVQFLNQNRMSNNNTSIATDIFTRKGESDMTSGNGSSSQIIAEADSNFWSELERNLTVILGTGTPQKENKPENLKRNDNDGGKNSSSTRKNGNKDASTEESSKRSINSFTVHRQAGLITVNANSRLHELVSDYLITLKKTTNTQVLIEAKIIEVNLKDEFKAGIDWRRLTKEGVQANLSLGKMAQEGKLTDPMHHQADMLTVGFRSDNFTSILNAIQQFGSSKTLSSPRLTVLNNQNAILKVAKNQVYFRLRYDREFNLNINRENLTVSSDIQTVPIGLVMSVQPSIDQTTGKIILSLRPTISRLSRSVADPAVDLAYAASGYNGERPQPSLIPVVDVREIDTLIETEPGKIVVLGGLMESRKAFEENKVPILGDVPLLGKLVTGQSEIDEVVELVILLKCTLMDNDTVTELDPADIRLVTDFTDDPRPIMG